jgi:predicted MPP superfamily phosphohydrolase
MNKRSSLAVAGGVALATLAYAAGIEPWRIQTVHWEIFAPRLPRAFDGFLIYQISDLHMSALGRRERRVIDILDSLPPADLVALTGDLIHTRDGIEPFMKLAEAIKSNIGTYAIFGNSEYKNGVQHLEFARRLQDASIPALLNQHVILERGSDEIVLAGVEDPRSELDDLELALTGVPEDVFKLALMHSPDSIADAVHYGVDLVLCGHTHGGQVVLPIVGPLVTHSWFGSRVSSGYYKGSGIRSMVGIRPGRTQLYVTRGIGMSALALRLFCRPEFTIITLRRGFPHARRIALPRMSRSR